jgi:hypothetical protein
MFLSRGPNARRLEHTWEPSLPARKQFSLSAVDGTAEDHDGAIS